MLQQFDRLNRLAAVAFSLFVAFSAANFLFLTPASVPPQILSAMPDLSFPVLEKVVREAGALAPGVEQIQHLRSFLWFYSLCFLGSLVLILLVLTILADHLGGELVKYPLSTETLMGVICILGICGVVTLIAAQSGHRTQRFLRSYGSVEGVVIAQKNLHCVSAGLPATFFVVSLFAMFKYGSRTSSDKHGRSARVRG